MKQTFLGKPIPSHKRPSPKRPVKPAWFGLLILPIVLSGAMLSMQKSALNPEESARTTGGALARSLAVVSPSPSQSPSPSPSPSNPFDGAGAEAAVGFTGTPVANPCTPEVVSKAFRSERNANHEVTNVSSGIILFPLIPDGINGYDEKGVNVKDMVKTDGSPDVERIDSTCQQGFWTKNVAYWFIYKILALLNWFAVAVAILFTIYGGVLYISGFANEGNVKKAKGLIIGAYVGLAIVFLARILVYGAVSLVSDENPESLGPPVEINGTPTPTPK